MFQLFVLICFQLTSSASSSYLFRLFFSRLNLDFLASVITTPPTFLLYLLPTELWEKPIIFFHPCPISSVYSWASFRSHNFLWIRDNFYDSCWILFNTLVFHIITFLKIWLCSVSTGGLSGGRNCAYTICLCSYSLLEYAIYKIIL